MPTPADSSVARAEDLNLEVKRLNRVRLVGSFLAIPVLLWLVYLTAQPDLYPWALRAIGVALMVAGIAIRLWALGCIEGRKKRVLVTWGPYGHVRHPLYCGSFLLGLGACVFAGAPLAGLITGAVYLALYLPSIRAEERFLALRFGPAWADYSSKVRALLPCLRSITAVADRAIERHWPLRPSIEMVSVAALAIAAGEWLRRVHPGDVLAAWGL